MNFFSKAFQKVRAIYLRLKFEKIITVAILITQALKRFVESDLGTFLIDLTPIPWVKYTTKIIALITKASEVAPQISQKMLIGHAFVSDADEQDALQLLTIHLRLKTKEERATFWKEFCDALIEAMADHTITSEERAELREEFYHKLMK